MKLNKSQRSLKLLIKTICSSKDEYFTSPEICDIILDTCNSKSDPKYIRQVRKRININNREKYPYDTIITEVSRMAKIGEISCLKISNNIRYYGSSEAIKKLKKLWCIKE
jgi:hypothetical protein